MTASKAARFKQRDYSLTGPEGQRAIEIGLASAEWYHPGVSRKTVKELMHRKDGPALRDTFIWFGLLGISAAGGINFWGSWWAVPFFGIYGVLYGSACDSRWHECGHGTAFRKGWLNDCVYHVASFMLMQNPVSWRWSHVRHHTDTIIVGRDPEIALKRPPDLLLRPLNFIGIPGLFLDIKILFKNAFGRFTTDERDYIPASEVGKAGCWARLHMAIYAAAILSAVVTCSFLPLVLIGGPRLYGRWHSVMTGFLQHGGLAEDVLDHRLNSRTVYMNPISRWIYWNMNYHVEHHMFPMVPYHALPALHAVIKHDLPIPKSSIFSAYAEMVPALWRQRTEPGYAILPVLPPTARAYQAEFHETLSER